MPYCTVSAYLLTGNQSRNILSKELPRQKTTLVTFFTIKLSSNDMEIYL